MSIDKQLHNYYNKSNEYIKLMHSHRDEFFASYLELISRYIKDSDKLLDVGCGPGGSTYAIACKFPFLNCTGIDISSTAIKTALSNYSLKNLNFEAGNAKSLSYPSCSFSIVTSFDCLEHIHDLDLVLLELMRVVKPGGCLIIKGPNHMSPLYTLADLVLFRQRYPFTRSWLDNFRRLSFELRHLVLGLAGRAEFVQRVPDLSDNVLVGNDADAVTDMSNLDVYNFFKRRKDWKIVNISWPRRTGKMGFIVSKVMPFLASMGIVAQKKKPQW